MSEEERKINSIPGFKLLNDSNYTDYKNDSYLYILVYKDSCKPCLEALDEMQMTMNYSKSAKIPIKYAVVNGEKNKDFVKDYKVSEYPTAIFFIKDQYFTYDGIPDHFILIKFLNRHFYGPVREIKKVTEIDETLKLNEYVVLSTLKDQNSTLYKSFIYTGDNTERYDFVYCLTDECYEKYGENIWLLSPNNTIHSKKISEDFKIGGDFSNNNTKIEINSVGAFIYSYLIDIGVQFKEDILTIMFAFNKEGLFYYRDKENETQTKYDKVLLEVDKELRKENIYTFSTDVIGNTSSSRMIKEMTEIFTITKEDLPALVYIKFDRGFFFDSLTYRKVNLDLEKELSKDNILKYVKDINDGRIQRDIKSRYTLTLLPSNDVGAKLVIGRTFENDILNEKNNVCVAYLNTLYYCDICTKYFEVFRTLGHKYENETEHNVIYAVFDPIANEGKDLNFSVSDLPAIYLYTNGMKEKKQIKFVPKNETEISVEEVENFVNENLEIKVNVEKEAVIDDKDKKEKEIKKEEDHSKSDL